MKAAIYTRVSTSEQAFFEKRKAADSPKQEEQEKKASLRIQGERCAAYCAAQGWEVAEVYEDAGVSGAKADRPALNRLLADAKEGKFERVVFLKLDRFARNVRHLHNIAHDLKGYGVSIASVRDNFDTGTPSGRFFFTMLGAFAEFERDVITERMTDGRLDAVGEGKFAGGSTPYGYRNDPETKAFMVDEAEAAVVDKVFRLYVEEGLSHERLAARLTAEGVPTRNRRHPKANGGTWNSVVISNMLRNPTYKGQGYYGKTAVEHIEVANGNGQKDEKTYQRARPQDEWLPLAFPPIVTEAVWAAAQERAAANRRASQHPNEASEIFATAGLVYCGVCLGKMTGERRYYRRDGKEREYHYLSCSRQRKGLTECRKRPLVRRDKVDAQALQMVLEGFADPHKVLDACRVYSEQLAAAQEDGASLLAALRRNLVAKEKERDGYERQFAQGMITEAKACQHFARVDGEMAEWQADIERLKATAKQGAALKEIEGSAFRIADMVRDGAVQKMTLAQRRRLMRALVERVRVMADNEVKVDCVVPGLLEDGSGQAPCCVLSSGGSRRDSFPGTQGRTPSRPWRPAFSIGPLFLF